MLMKMKMKFTYGILMLAMLFFSSCSNPAGEDNDKTVPESEPDGVIARWDFKNNDASRIGSLAAKNLVFLDKSGNGNNLELRVYDASKLGTPIENLSFSSESMIGAGGSMLFEKTYTASALKDSVLADFITAENAPMNGDAFEDGYTFEFLYKLPSEYTAVNNGDMGVMRREMTYQGSGLPFGAVEIDFSAVKEVRFFSQNKNAAPEADIWSLYIDNTGEWYHIAVVSDNKEVRTYLNGAFGFARNRHILPNDGSGTGLFVDESSSRFIVGSSQLNASTDPIAAVDPAEILRKTLFGNLETVRVSNKALDMKDWLIADFAPHLVNFGNNNPYTLQGPSNGASSYVFGFIPDTQMVVKWYSPETNANTPLTWDRPGVLDNAAEYLAANHAAMKLKALMHLGDVVEDQRQEWQYKVFERALMKMVNAGVKVQMGHGNHDLGGADGFYAQYFRNSTSPYAQKVSAATGGYVTFEDDSSDLLSSYMTVKAGSYEYLFISMQYTEDPFSTAHINWLKGVLDDNPGKPTVIFSHNLIDVGGVEPNVALNTTGISLWRVATAYNQVFLIAAGHKQGTGWRTQKNSAGNDVFMMLVDYQYSYNGGNAYLRLLEFNETANKIYFSTFSPAAAYLTVSDKSVYDLNYMTGTGNEGVWDINFATRFKF